VPYGTAQGLPIGVQVLAPALGEPVMFRTARAIEQLAKSAATVS
jgi:Asp-tRNA(Asn)/Glu-tRNA(Gln) amidotransferase A subunit family amidase